MSLSRAIRAFAEWKPKERELIERIWNDMKSPKCTGAGKGNLFWRGLSQVGMYWAAAAAASNLRKLRTARSLAVPLAA